MATIRKRGSKWEAQIRRKGHRTVSRSFDTQTDANTWARRIEVGLELGNLELPERSKTEIKLGDLVERYLAEVTKDKRGREPEEYRLRRFLTHPICSKRVTELKTEDFATYRDQRLRQVVPSSVKRELAVIQHMIEVAKSEWGIPLRDNPLSDLRLNVPNDQRDRRLQPGELDRILSAASATRTKHLSEIILFAIETGMRRGEIVSIRWRDVDLQRRSVRLTQTKNGRPRSIPLSKAAMGLLPVQNGSHEDAEARVFPITGNALRLAWERVKKRAGIEDLRFHDLRHEAISRFFEKGLSVPEVASISGHRDLRMLQRYSNARNEVIFAKLDAD